MGGGNDGVLGHNRDVVRGHVWVWETWKQISIYTQIRRNIRNVFKKIKSICKTQLQIEKRIRKNEIKPYNIPRILLFVTQLESNEPRMPSRASDWGVEKM